MQHPQLEGHGGEPVRGIFLVEDVGDRDRGVLSQAGLRRAHLVRDEAVVHKY